MFKEIRERLESVRVRNTTFLLQLFERKKNNIEDFLGSLLDPKFKYMRRLLEERKTYIFPKFRREP
ncbi:hypothetical protein IGI04_018891 [Brassica rapa subsp. trilocularis]|uniref:PORR domain-containing protein n=1 Tax=Brassica rapa subsp. trilocularis TaxID=1813537 RepID=A0ABQ7MEN0_BRACM|nr:hypothetical protein IGI04_018891 [Brassica rapa subsp. trilocularis]